MLCIPVVKEQFLIFDELLVLEMFLVCHKYFEYDRAEHRIHLWYTLSLSPYSIQNQSHLVISQKHYEEPNDCSGIGTTEEKRVENRELTQLWERKSYTDGKKLRRNKINKKMKRIISNIKRLKL